MTVRINFLPRNYQPPKQMGSKEIGIAAAAALALAATGIYYTTAYAGTVNMEKQVLTQTAKLRTVQAALAEADEIKARETAVARAEADLKALSGRHWSGVLVNLSQLTPQQVAWTSIKAGGNDIVLQGTSRGLVDVAQLMGGLVTETSVDMVSLKFINEKGIPIMVTMKAGDSQSKVVSETVRELGTMRQLEFELTITLVPVEGRELPSGA